MDTPTFSLDPATPGEDILQLTVSPAATSLDSSTPEPSIDGATPKSDEKRPVKKRKSWGQELPTPKTNLPPRKRAKTEDEKEQRRIERVLRNRAAAQTSRERKRLEVEKLEGEKQQIEEQNEFLLQRLAQMEAENNRLNKQVAQLSAEIRTSRGGSPQSVTSSASPTLAPTLFKQEREELSMDKIPFRTPISEYSPSLKPSDLAETSDLAQHPAAVLCDLQCQSEDSKDRQVSLSQRSSLSPIFTSMLHMMQLLFLTTTFGAYSTVIQPLSQIFHSLKEGSPLMFSTEEIHRHFPLILWLISTPSLSASTASTRRPVFRIQLLTRLLACSPFLARPLRDATSEALQQAAREMHSGPSSSRVDGYRGLQDWELLLTMIWAIDCIGRSARGRRAMDLRKKTSPSSHVTRVKKNLAGSRFRSGSARRFGGLNGKALTSFLMGKPQ